MYFSLLFYLHQVATIGPEATAQADKPEVIKQVTCQQPCLRVFGSTIFPGYPALS